ncbi:hypothetical protein BJV77DRAFT_966068 [Russula vinacea]|nr:hypothetical protein BJV77DRAFT_966068 [Russula vinacea]
MFAFERNFPPIEASRRTLARSPTTLQPRILLFRRPRNTAPGPQKISTRDRVTVPGSRQLYKYVVVTSEERFKEAAPRGYRKSRISTPRHPPRDLCAPRTRLWCEVFQHCVGTAGLDRLVAPRWSCGGLGLAKIADHDAFLKKRWAHKLEFSMGATSMGVPECCGAVLQPGPPLFPVTLVARKLRHRSIYEGIRYAKKDIGRIEV